MAFGNDQNDIQLFEILSTLCRLGIFSGLSDYADEQICFSGKFTQGSRGKNITKIADFEKNNFLAIRGTCLGAFWCIMKMGFGSIFRIGWDEVGLGEYHVKNAENIFKKKLLRKRPLDSHKGDWPSLTVGEPILMVVPSSWQHQRLSIVEQVW